jgi:integrase
MSLTSSATLRHVLDWYVSRSLGLSAGYTKQLSVAVGAVERWHQGPVRLSQLSGDFLRRFLAEHLRTHAAATTNSRRRALLTLWRAAAAEGACSPPPIIPRAREPRRLPTAWTKAEVERLIEVSRRLTGAIGPVARRDWWSSLLVTIYWTGSRVSALLSARTADCSLEAGYLILRAEHVKTAADVMFWLSGQAVEAIAAHYDAARELIWPWPYSAAYLWRFFRRKIVEPAGLRSDPRRLDLFHKLRRTSISLCAARGLELARRQAGHADAHLTLRSYVDPRIARPAPPARVLPELAI